MWHIVNQIRASSNSVGHSPPTTPLRTSSETVKPIDTKFHISMKIAEHIRRGSLWKPFLSFFSCPSAVYGAVSDRSFILYTFIFKTNVQIIKSQSSSRSIVGITVDQFSGVTPISLH